MGPPESSVVGKEFRRLLLVRTRCRVSSSALTVPFDFLGHLMIEWCCFHLGDGEMMFLGDYY